ncbi:MAG TPA: YceI family protein [Anaerolineales bacterium]|nr:YceI family protein [Anaerolineales bacterium]HRF49937.1 YceI family protein [Anaerolineales bacterium]
MTWNLDLSHSEVTFAVKHMMISTVRGKFNTFSGTIDFNEADPASSAIDVSIDVASVDTRDEKRDGHLKSGDFFDVAQFPAMTFKSTKVEKLSETTAKVTGDLTIRGVSRPVVLDVTYAGQAKSPWGTVSAGFSATTRVNRKDWGLTWNVALETGGVLVGEDVTIAIEAELVKQPETQSA